MLLFGHRVARAYRMVGPSSTAFQHMKFFTSTPNAKVTFDQMQYVRTQDSIGEAPGAPAAIEDAVREVTIDGKNVKAVLEELQRKLTTLAQDVRQ